MSLVEAYDAIHYIGLPFPQTHPDRLATQATLLGLHPAPPANCRVLELGCGDGGNLVPMAAALPDSEFLGVDITPSAIDRAQRFAQGVELTNVRFLAADLRELPADVGQFDYVIAHGVWSWVPADVQEALLALVRRHLAEQGVAFISYNAYPGSHLRDMVGEVLRSYADLTGAQQPGERLAAAKHLREVLASPSEDSPHAHVLAGAMQRLGERHPAQVFHDELAPICTPVYFREFVARAAEHDLAFLAEAHLADSQPPRLLTADAAALLDSAGDDIVLREQYLDFVRNRSFRETLLCHTAMAPVSREIDVDRLSALHAAAPARRVDPADPLSATQAFVLAGGTTTETADQRYVDALDRLGAAWPMSVPVADLAQGDDGIARALLATHAGRGIELHVHSPSVQVAGERPAAWPVARWQATRGETTIATLRHAGVRLDDTVRRLIMLFDGTRTRPELVDELRAIPGNADVPDLADALDAVLDHLEGAGLFGA